MLLFHISKSFKKHPFFLSIFILSIIFSILNTIYFALNSLRKEAANPSYKVILSILL
ncbi:hypothetical protein KSU1_C0441 [Candidatus Jettenia caeni]|uniref:Uncharacterized protein n=1 Tax=Candidatus Jettenia caeni TaxID=247490 RepID=I3IJZ2_9BACT|nr:hypothetical protein KSU1_C0441 [Candidatus Jettenia caeni]